MEDVLAALQILLTFKVMAFMVTGMLAGILAGALPGLTATMSVALLVPFTFRIEPPIAGLMVLLGVYVGAMHGTPSAQSLFARRARLRPPPHVWTDILWRRKAVHRWPLTCPPLPPLSGVCSAPWHCGALPRPLPVLLLSSGHLRCSASQCSDSASLQAYLKAQH